MRETVDRPLGVPGDVLDAQVEVLNGTSIDGLARRVTRLLRSRGIDVVFFGSTERADSTTLFIRRAGSTAARSVRDALGVGRIVVELDPHRLLDVTVVLGPDAAAVERYP